MRNDDDFEEMKRILSDPFHCRGLPPRRASVHTRIWMYPSFTPWASWSLLRDDQYYVRRITWHPADRTPIGSPDTYAAEGVLPAQTAESVLEQLALLELRPFGREDEVVVDGVTYGVRSGSDLVASQVEFWGTPPKGLEPVARWMAETVEALEAHLPASTIDIDRVAF